MQRYKVIATLNLGAGAVLGLSEAQAKPRKHALEAKGKGVYVATQPLSFKVGEILGLDDPNLKRLSNVLEPVDGPQPRGGARADAS